MKDNIHTQKFLAPFWCLNSHIHTIASTFFAERFDAEYDHIEVPTPDEDFLELDIIPYKESNKVAVLFHGLEGSANRFYVKNLAQTFNQIGFKVVAVNFRGCGNKINKQPHYYNAGFTQDYKTVFNWVEKNMSYDELHAVGFSLGGNALIKYLGEEGSSAKPDKTVIVSTPYDLLEGAYTLQKGFNKVYDKYFVRSVHNKLELKREIYPDLPNFTGSTLYDFDDQITATIHGYKDAIDYYNSNSSKNFIGDIKTPTLLIHSLTDPICPIKFAPFGVIKSNPHIETLFLENGGHVGFWAKEKNWLNMLIAEWTLKS